MKLTFNRATNGINLLPVTAGRVTREWMDQTPDKFAYRCLPLTMANATGWELLNPVGFEVEWNGGIKPSDLEVRLPEGHFAVSSFGSGILTIHPGYVIETEQPNAVLATGAPNFYIDGIIPLTGLVETYWLNFSFTMNWKMTRPGVVKFKKDDPLVFIVLLQHTIMDETRATICDMPREMKQKFWQWSDSRRDFNKKLSEGDPEAAKQGWQKTYTRGEIVPGCPFKTSEFHTTKRKMDLTND